ncbi:unnamed protein product [Auanema sp. JU1783]|nr:unnamed protein product [Auanema sp. JU1783]
MEVHEVPPPPLKSSDLINTALPYAFLFLVGTIGNTAVLSYVFFITRSLRSSISALGNTFIYIVSLSAVDLLVTISIPFTLSSLILNNWVFGELGCKIHWAVELSNKLCSTFLLTALAFDRYMAICHPENKRIHHMRQTALITSLLALLSFCLILPIIFTSTVRKTPSKDSVYYHKNVKMDVYRHMCVDGLRTEGKVLVSIFLILFAFVMPCTLMTFFYAKIILRLRKQQRRMMQSRIPIRRITIYTMVVTFFHLSCQIPFWLPQVYAVVIMVFKLPGNNSYLTFLYYSHLLPFVSAAFNWIFYARLNSQFKKGLVLVTERMIRKRTRSIQQNGITSTNNRETIDEMALDLMVSSPNELTTCPNCDAPLTTKTQKKSVANST